VTQTFAILAKRGVGKSYTASVMAEEMLKAGHTIIALDPTGAWWGLRSLTPS
jgi:DNA helicase HerA-like ATPase